MTEGQKGHLAMLAFSALVAGSFSLGSMAAPHIDPAALNAIRFTLGAVSMWAVTLMMGPVPRSVFAAPWRYGVLAGLYAFYFVTMFEGLKTAEPVSMAAVFTLNPALAAVFGYFVMAQITTPRMALAIVIGGIGALWVIFRADLGLALAFDVGRGETIYFFGCIAHALYAPLMGKFSRGEPALAFTACVLTAGAVILLIWAAPAFAQITWSALPGIVWVTILYTALAATALTVALIRYAALRLPSAKVMAYTYLVPSWVVLWELGFGRGAPPALLLVGVGLTVSSLALLLKDEGQEA